MGGCAFSQAEQLGALRHRTLLENQEQHKTAHKHNLMWSLLFSLYYIDFVRDYSMNVGANFLAPTTKEE